MTETTTICKNVLTNKNSHSYTLIHYAELYMKLIEQRNDNLMFIIKNKDAFRLYQKLFGIGRIQQLKMSKNKQEKVNAVNEFLTQFSIDILNGIISNKYSRNYPCDRMLISHKIKVYAMLENCSLQELTTLNKISSKSELESYDDHKKFLFASPEETVEILSWRLIEIMKNK